MAEVIKTKIEADTGEAEDNMNKVVDLLGKINNNLEDSKKGVEDLGDQSKKTSKEVSVLSKGFRGVGKAVKGFGGALKAVGIGIIIGLVSKLTEFLSQNQKIVDATSQAFGTLAGVFNQFTKPLISVATTIASAGENFDALGRVIKNILNIAITPLQISFKGIQAAIISAQLAYEQSWFGDDDPEKIKKLSSDLSVVKDDIVELGNQAIESGKQIGEDFTEAFQEAGDIFSKVKDAVVQGYEDIDFAAASSAAKQMTSQQQRVKELEIEQQRLRDFYDAEAERLRQIRDDSRLTIEERIQANNNLLDILNLSREAQRKTVEERIKALRQENSLYGESFERNLEIKQLTTELQAIDAEYEGFKSEQIANLILLEKLLQDSKKETGKVSRDEVEKTKKTEVDYEEQAAEQRKQITMNLLGSILAISKAFSGKTEKQQEQAFKRNKALSLAEATVSTYLSATKAYASQISIITPDAPIRAAAAAAAAVAAGLANIAVISKQKFQPQGGGGGGAISGGGGSSFSSFGGADTPTIGSIPTFTNTPPPINGSDSEPIRAFLVEDDISTAQNSAKALQRRTIL